MHGRSGASSQLRDVMPGEVGRRHSAAGLAEGESLGETDAFGEHRRGTEMPRVCREAGPNTHFRAHRART